jgi:Lhr-like helicase
MNESAMLRDPHGLSFLCVKLIDARGQRHDEAVRLVLVDVVRSHMSDDRVMNWRLNLVRMNELRATQYRVLIAKCSGSATTE